MTLIDFPKPKEAWTKPKTLEDWPWDNDMGKPHGVSGDVGVREPDRNDLAPLVDKADMINKPPHYTSHPSGVECRDICRHFPYNLGVAIAYIWRHELKGGTEDLKKAVNHLEDEIKWRENHSGSGTGLAGSSVSNPDVYHGC